MRAFANECQVCMRSQFCSRDACTCKTRNRSRDWNVRLSIFSSFDLKLKFLLRFQLACLASSAKQADWLNLSKFCWFRRHWSCGPRCRDCSSGPSTKSLNCLRFRLLKMVKTLQPLLLLRVRRVLISKAKMLDTISWSVAAGTFSCDQLNHFFCSFIVLNFCDIEWTEQFGLFFPVDCSSCFKL